MDDPVGEIPLIPAFYPADLTDRLGRYLGNESDKASHDVLLELALAGVQCLATMAVSIAVAEPTRSDTEQPVIPDQTGFGGWVKLMLKYGPTLPGWEITGVDLDSARPFFNVVQRLLKKEHDPFIPKSGKAPSFDVAWGDLAMYRNKTIGHHNEMADLKRWDLTKYPRYYARANPLLAAAVAALLWNPVIESIMTSYRIAMIESRNHVGVAHSPDPDWLYRIKVRSGGPRSQVFDSTVAFTLPGDTAPLSPGDSVVVTYDGSVARFVAPCWRPTERKQAYVQVFEGPPATDAGQEAIDPATNSTEPAAAGHTPDDAPAAPAPNAAPHHFAAMVPVAPGTATAQLSDGQELTVVIAHHFELARHLVTEDELRSGTSSVVDPGLIASGLPASSVSWLDAVAYCNELSRNTGLEPVYGPGENGQSITVDASLDGFRLPLEDEWVYSCILGLDGASDRIRASSAAGGSARRELQAIDAEPDHLGFVHLMGNVSQWCNDLYRDDYVPGATGWSIVPTRYELRLDRVLRGGSYLDPGTFGGLRNRFHGFETKADRGFGFRIARTISHPTADDDGRSGEDDR